MLAAPVMAAVMLIAGHSTSMGRLTLPRPMLIMGWSATGIMFAVSIVFVSLSR